MVWTIAAVICVGAFGERAEACLVGRAFPQFTVVDKLLWAETVVLARENPEQPFSYIATEVLKGELHEPQIDLFLDTTMRRRLAMNPDRSVVLVLSGKGGRPPTGQRSGYTPGAVAAAGTWQSIGYASVGYEALVRDILSRAEAWRAAYSRDIRGKYFLPHLTDPERAVRDLAYLEVSQASYSVIREADGLVPADQLSAFLADPQYVAWHPLFILLLGIDADTQEAERVRGTIGRQAQLNYSVNLAAWAAALIEIDTEDAISWLEAAYLAETRRDNDAVAEVLKALSMHGTRTQAELRERIVESYGLVLQTHPTLAGIVARDLLAWRDWRFVDQLTELRESNTLEFGVDGLVIDSYIRRAQAGLSSG